MLSRTPIFRCLAAIIPLLLLSSVAAYPSGGNSSVSPLKRNGSHKDKTYKITIVNRNPDFRLDKDRGPVMFTHSREDWQKPALALEYQAKIVNDQGEAKYKLMRYQPKFHTSPPRKEGDYNPAFEYRWNEEDLKGQNFEKGEFRTDWPDFTKCHFDVDKTAAELGDVGFVFQTELGDRSWLDKCGYQTGKGFRLVCLDADGEGAACRNWDAPADSPDHTFYIDIKNRNPPSGFFDSTLRFFDGAPPDAGSVYFYLPPGGNKLPFSYLRYKGVVKEGKTTWSLVNHDAIESPFLHPKQAYGEKDKAKFEVYMHPEEGKPGIRVHCEITDEPGKPAPPKNSDVEFRFQAQPGEFVQQDTPCAAAGNVRMSCKIGDLVVTPNCFDDLQKAPWPIPTTATSMVPTLPPAVPTSMPAP